MKRKETFKARKAGNCFITHNRGIVPGYGFVYDRKAWNAMTVEQRKEIIERGTK